MEVTAEFHCALRKLVSPNSASGVHPERVGSSVSQGFRQRAWAAERRPLFYGRASLCALDICSVCSPGSATQAAASRWRSAMACSAPRRSGTGINSRPTTWWLWHDARHDQLRSRQHQCVVPPRHRADHCVLLGLKLHMGDRTLQQTDRTLQQTDRAGATLDIISPDHQSDQPCHDGQLRQRPQLIWLARLFWRDCGPPKGGPLALCTRKSPMSCSYAVVFGNGNIWLLILTWREHLPESRAAKKRGRTIDDCVNANHFLVRVHFRGRVAVDKIFAR